MYVCICNALNDRQVSHALDQNPAIAAPAGVHRALGCRTRCGRCLPAIASMMDERRPGKCGMICPPGDMGMALAAD